MSERRCACGMDLSERRSHARACSPRCRVKASRTRRRKPTESAQRANVRFAGHQSVQGVIPSAASLVAAIESELGERFSEGQAAGLRRLFEALLGRVAGAAA